jgi:hypothetical protein
MKRFIHLMTAGLVAVLVFVTGCGGSPRAVSSELRIEVAGDPGVAAHFTANRDGKLVWDTILTAPNSVNWGSGDFDITCTPIGKPGHLKILIFAGESQSALDANEPGTVIKIKLRGHFIEATTINSGGTSVSRASF